MDMMRTSGIRIALGIAMLVAVTACNTTPPAQPAAPPTAEGGMDRTVLPLAEPKPATYKELDARNAKAPARFEVKAPAKAPNVVIVLIVDVGFGGTSTFGGPIRTPTMDKLAQGWPARRRGRRSRRRTG